VNWLVILAGGRGERFWPLSRTARPKQFLRLLGDKTLLQETASRVAGLVDREHTLVVTGRDYQALVAEQLPGARVLAEPVGRNTAASIAWAAFVVRREDPGGVMAVLPSDHAVGDVPQFSDAVARAMQFAGREGRMTLLGVKPTRPETGYGYIEIREPSRPNQVVPVAAFVEKPDVKRAEAMLASGRFFWNAGMFMLPVNVVWQALEQQLPRVVAAVQASDRPDQFDAQFRALDPVSFDVGVMEHSRDLSMLPLDVGWDDVGSFAAVARILANRAPDRVVWERVQDVTVIGDDGPWIAGIGLEHLVVVRTPDAVLILPPEEAQAVRALVRQLTTIERGSEIT